MPIKLFCGLAPLLLTLQSIIAKKVRAPFLLPYRLPTILLKRLQSTTFSQGKFKASTPCYFPLEMKNSFHFSGVKRNDHVINDLKLVWHLIRSLCNAIKDLNRFEHVLSRVFFCFVKRSEKLRSISKYKFDESSKVSDQTVWIRTRSQSQRGRDQRHLHVNFETITMEFDLRLFGRKHFPFILPQLLSCSQRMQLI